MRSTNIADLRNRLTHYLREVRAGEEVVVRDRQRPIAKIVPFTVDDDDPDDAALGRRGSCARGRSCCRHRSGSRARPRVTLKKAVTAVRADRD